MRSATSDALAPMIEPLTTSPVVGQEPGSENSVMALPHRRDAKNFGGRCDAGAAFGDGVVDHRRHAGAARGEVDRAAIRLRPDEFVGLALQFEHFENAVAAAIADAAAALAAGRFIDAIVRLEAERAEARIGGDIGDC